MKFKLNQREKNLCLIFIGVVLLAVSYYFGYTVLKAETEKLRLENKALEQQITALEEMGESKEYYITQTKEMQKSMNSLLQKFPADVISEDIILYVKNLENKTEIYVNHVTMPAKETLEINAEYEDDVLTGIKDITGVIEEYGFVNKGTIPKTRDMNLYKIKSDMVYSVSYEGLKEVIRQIVEDEHRKSVDNISLVFNENTGNLAGSMTVNYFALSGTGKEYRHPEISNSLYGVDCIFGDLRTDFSAE